MPGSDELGFLVILNKSSELRFGQTKRIDFSDLGEASEFVDCGVRVRVVGVSELKADDGRTVSREKLCLSLLVSKNLNLKKVIKVSYLDQERVVSVSCFSGFLCL